MLMSEFGGFFKSFHFIIFLAVQPIAQYLYFIVMIKRLYFVKCPNEKLFMGKKTKKSSYVRHRLSKYLEPEHVP